MTQLQTLQVLQSGIKFLGKSYVIIKSDDKVEKKKSFEALIQPG